MESTQNLIEVEREVEQVAQPEHETIIKGGSCPTCRSGLDPLIVTTDFQAALNDSL